MAALSSDNCVIGGIFASLIAFLLYCHSDGQALAQLTVKGLLCLGFVTLIIHWSRGSWLHKLVKGQSQPASSDSIQHDNKEVRSKQQKARQKIQHDYDAKATKYHDNILKPREEAERKKREEKFYRLAGPAWKGEGRKLGHTDKNTEGDETGYVEPGASRLLAEHEVIVQNAPKPPPPKVGKKIVLPEEPPEGSSGSIAVVLRTPQGRTFKRRFLVTETVQVLLDYMTTVGYHQRYYTVSTSFPRRSLADQAGLSLETLGFTKDVALNVEERGDE